MTLIPILMSLLFINPGIAAGVAERMTCMDINSRLAELMAIEEPDAETLDEITKLKADYRRNCAKSAGKRKTSGSGRVVVAATEEVVASDPEPNQPDTPSDTTETEPVISADATPASVSSDDVVAVASVDDASADDAAQIDAALVQELFNLDSGLCADGTQPNKFGCCNDEIFKDMGGTVFACCPPQGGDCFPPIQ